MSALFHVPSETFGTSTSDQEVLVDQGEGGTFEEEFFEWWWGWWTAVRCWAGQTDWALIASQDQEGRVNRSILGGYWRRQGRKKI